MEKSRKRAERRWRSYCTWMRRLKRDWRDHGRGSYPVPLYDFVGGIPQVTGWVSSLCACFDLKNREALRFKDTPNQKSYRRKGRDLYRTGRRNDVPVQELRVQDGPQEDSGPRRSTYRRRGPSEPRRDRCFCGHVAGPARCPNCKPDRLIV